jgi:tetratricopeptide (TPR) repeat protein
MAAVAIASASVAFFSAHWASLAAEKDGVALQQRAERDRIEQNFNIEIAEDQRLWAAFQAHDKAAAYVRKQAATVRAADPERAVLLDLEYQGHVAAKTALLPLFQAWAPSGTEGEMRYDEAAARRALEAGDVNLPRLAPEMRHAEAEDLYRQALSLVLLILALIASLFVLTIAQVFSRFAYLVGAIGVGLAIGTAIEIASIDPKVAPWLILAATIAAGLSGIQLLGSRLPRVIGQWFPSAEEVESAAEASVHGAGRSSVIHEHATPEPPIVGPDLARDRMSQMLVVSIAAMTLAAAWIGYLQIDSAHRAENQAVLAQHHALMALTMDVEGSTTAEAAVSAHIRRVETQVALSNARQQQIYWLSVGASRRAADLAVTIDARKSESDAAAAAAAAVIPVSLGPVDYASTHPVGDPSFPNRLRVSADEDALMHGAFQDAANRASATLTARSRELSFAVAVLAVVLYLLGLALVMRSRALRWTFAVAAGVLVLIAIGRILPLVAPWASHDAPDASAEEAASAYARGYVELAVAGPGGDLSAAIADLETAVRLRPAFAQAYAVLAEAALRAGSPQYGGNVSVEDERTEEQTIELLRRAADNDAQSTTSEIDLGFLLYRQAIRSAPVDQASLSESIEVTQAAIDDLEPGERDSRAVAFANLGVAYLAAGRTSDAQRSYDSMTALLTTGEADSDAWREGKVAGALTDLDNLASAQPTMAEVVQVAKANLVAGIWAAPDGMQAEVTNLEITGKFRSWLEWTAHSTSRTPFDQGNVISQWYRQAPSGEWFVLPTASGKAGGWVETYVNTAHAGGVVGRARMTASGDLSCHDDGERNRLELYVDGHLAASKEMTVASGDTTPPEASAMIGIGDRTLGVAACIPEGWTRTYYEPGLGLGYEAKAVSGYRRGLYAFRIQEAGPPPAGACSGSKPAIHAIGEVLSADPFSSTLPPFDVDGSDAGVTTHLEWTCLENRYLTAHVVDDGSPGVAIDLNPDGPQYGYLRAAPQADGSVIAVVVFGPHSDFDEDGDLGLLLMDAILPY